MTTTQAYQEWLTVGRSSRVIIEAVEFKHPAWQALRIVNWERTQTFTHEDGTAHEYLPAHFIYNKPELSNSLDQSTSFQFGSYDGQVYKQLRLLSYDQRKTPLSMTYRLYMDGAPKETLIKPPPTWSVNQVTVGREVVEISLQAVPTRVQRVGEYYVKSEFPVLSYV